VFPERISDGTELLLTHLEWRCRPLQTRKHTGKATSVKSFCFSLPQAAQLATYLRGKWPYCVAEDRHPEMRE